MRPYFELGHVREGIFYVANKLYGITFTEIKDIPKPDPDALAFECKDKDGTLWACCIWISLPARAKEVAHGAAGTAHKRIKMGNG